MDSETERSSFVSSSSTKEDYQKKKESGVKEYKIEQQISAKKQMNDKYKVFLNIYKFYKYIILDETLVCLNKSLNFLTKYETIIKDTLRISSTLLGLSFLIFQGSLSARYLLPSLAIFIRSLSASLNLKLSNEIIS